MERLYGLIGYPLGHSFSASYFAEKFEREGITETTYRNFPIDSIEKLPQLLADHPNLQGFNITIPYKEVVMPYLDSVSEEVKTIGAVNCVKIEEGKLTGYNTDTYGFTASLLNLIGKVRPGALILGTGGASKAVAYSLDQLRMPYQLVSRTSGIDPNGLIRLDYADITSELLADHPLLINTTPLGTFPNVEQAPDIPYEILNTSHYLFDLVYNPPLTRFLAEGEIRGARIMNGYDMLVGQAEKAWEIWNASSR